MPIRRKSSGKPAKQAATRPAMTNRDKQEAFRARNTSCPRVTCADPDRRARLEADDLAWCAHYLAEAFPKPFGSPHEQIAVAFREAVTNGNWCIVEASRGTGKTTEVNSLALKCALTGAVRFVAVIPWKDADAQRALRFWRNALCHNQRLCADYPEICGPFRNCKGSSQRLAAMHWADEEEPTGAMMVLSDGLIVLPGGSAVLGSASLNGNPRGMQFTVPDGTVLRPQLLLIDDPSDKKTARSAEQSRQNVEKIKEDVLGMAGPGEKIAAVMTGTPISCRDTVSHFSSDAEPDWAKVSVPQITAWPNERAMLLWEEWDEERRASRGSGLAGALDFYRRHKAEMLEGFSVSWIDRYDKRQGEPDAYWSAMADYYRMGRKAFLQERQNEPEEEASGLFVLDPEKVASRTGTHKRGEWPDDAEIVTAGIDVGTATALNWCVTANTPALACYVAEYGTYPGGNDALWTEKSSETSNQAIRRGLDYVIRMLLKRFPALRAIGIDGNYATQLVYEVAKHWRAESGIEIVPCRGVGSTKFRLPQQANRHKLKALGEQCHGFRGDKGDEVWFNAHHWQKTLQEGFLNEMGAPGSVQFFHGGQHRDMAMAICADRLVRVEIRPDGKEIHIWQNDARFPNHLADALKLALVQANLEGATSNGTIAKARNKRKTRIPQSYAVRRRK